MEKLLNLLRLERAQLASSALASPTEKTEFEYGRVSGLYQGLTQAIEAVEQSLAGNEEEETE